MSQMQDTTLALAAILQSSHLVYQLAHKGIYTEEEAYPLLYSLFQFEADNTAAVYDQVAKLQLGLELIQAYLGGSAPAYQKQPDVIRYALALSSLERYFDKNSAMQTKVHQQLLQIQTPLQPDIDSLLYAELATIYQNNLSQLEFKIYIKGNPEYLKNSRYVAKIRSLLLAGIRSTMLWRQSGGNRWQLFFKRKKIVQCSNDYLRQIKTFS